MSDFVTKVDGGYLVSEAMLCDVTVGSRSEDESLVKQYKLRDFPANAIEEFIAYGFQRKFNDRLGGADKTMSDKLKTLDDMIERFKLGNIGRATTVRVDPIQYELHLQVRRSLRATNKQKWTALKQMERPDAVAYLDGIVAQYKDGHPEIYSGMLKKAAGEVKRKKADAANVAALPTDGITL